MTQAVPEQRPQLPGFSKWLAPQWEPSKRNCRFLVLELGLFLSMASWLRWRQPGYLRLCDAAHHHDSTGLALCGFSLSTKHENPI